MLARSPFRTCGAWGARFARANEAFTLSFEWDHIQHSSILDSLRQAAEEGRSGFEPAVFEGLELDDGDEFHVGAEYAFFQTEPILALRLGAWLDPDHRIRFVGDDALERAELPPGSDHWHFALGFGIAFPSLQIDLGLDFSELVDIASVSLIYSF